MITSLAWIPRGVTPKILKQAENDEELVNQYLKIIEGDHEVVQEPLHPISEEDSAIIAKYDLNNYDNDENVDQSNPEIVEDDQYRINQTEEDLNDEDVIKNSDYLLVVGKSVDPDSSLEVHVFDDEEKSFYPHHELMIPSFPLSICWIDGEPGTGNSGSFAAVSSMLHHIEIWDLNILESAIPHSWLIHHTDSVPTLSWNPLQRSALLSASVDGTTAVWSLNSLKPVAIFNLGNNRPNNQKYAQGKSAEWNPKQTPIFGVGTDEGVFGYDVRSGLVFNSALGASIDTFVWLNDGNKYLSSIETGEILCFDIRNPNDRLYSFQAHNEHVTGLAVCKKPNFNLISSIGEDGFCKIWNLENDHPNKILEDEMNMGPLFSCQFCPDKPLLLAIGGNTSETRIWDLEPDL